MSTKRSFTVPVLLVLLVGVSILTVLFYSKWILAQQQDVTDKGQALAERYNYAIKYTDRLQAGAEQYLAATTPTERHRGSMLIGEANLASEELGKTIIDAERIANGGEIPAGAEDTVYADLSAITGKSGLLYNLAAKEGAPSDAERAMLSIARDGSKELGEKLKAFHVPSGEAGYRQMESGGDWVKAALEANEVLHMLAVQLQ